MKRDLTQLNKVEKYLKTKGISYERVDEWAPPNYLDKHMICVPCFEPRKREWDVICHFGSYGCEEGLLEIYGQIVPEETDDSVQGWLTAVDVIELIEVWMKEKDNGQKS